MEGRMDPFEMEMAFHYQDEKFFWNFYAAEEIFEML